MTSVSNRKADGRMPHPRTADPYRDLDVIDGRAPRTYQATIGGLAVLAFIVDWWPILVILALQLFVGLRLGRHYCLPFLAYFELIQPRFGEGTVEDVRPHRFAGQVAFVSLGSAALAHLAGLTTLGWVMGLLLAGSAILAATAGICVGCMLYRLGARLRGAGRPAANQLDPSDLGVAAGKEATILFTHPLCVDCHRVERELIEDGAKLVIIDVREEPDLARRHGISVVPTVLRFHAYGVTVAVP